MWGHTSTVRQRHLPGTVYPVFPSSVISQRFLKKVTDHTVAWQRTRLLAIPHLGRISLSRLPSLRSYLGDHGGMLMIAVKPFSALRDSGVHSEEGQKREQSETDGEPPVSNSQIMFTGPPDTYIGTGYVVAPKGDGGIDDVIATLRETLTVQLLAIPKISFPIARSYIDLAMAEHCALRIQDSIKHYSEALSIYQLIQKQLSGKTHHEHIAKRRRIAQVNEAKCFSYLGVAYRDWGDIKKAEEHLEKSLKIKHEVLGVNHPMTADTIHNLGSIYQMHGDYRKAVGFYEESIRFILTATNAESESPYIAIGYYNLGICYMELREWKNARTSLERAATISRAVLGEEHITTIRVMEAQNQVNEKLNIYSGT
eukprot:GHVQ01015918.1.p1 GENE.GHVQ01015918.1~~GHVQ01015918.1.p1  ORF type:complete len:369 (+),score=20.10 GHVQ01015918.1:3228-4334(+)